jgi:beta-glucanase (GH16 family)
MTPRHSTAFGLCLVGLIGCPDPSEPADTQDDVVDVDTAGTESEGTDVETQSNRLANGGFELGASWWRPSGVTNHDWVRTGDAIHDSAETFVASAQKFWGMYAGSVPNTSEHGLTLTDLTALDTHVVTARALTAADDAVLGGSEAVLFLRYLNSGGDVLSEQTSLPVDDDFPKDLWEELRVEAQVPSGAVSGELGLRFALADWNATGSVYVDDVVWTSTGTGSVAGERLLVWHDEFDGSTLNDDNWTRLELPAYTFNAEMQTYTTSTNNAAVEDGHLIITARQESSGSITSARLVTDGKAEWTYGRMEAFAQVPSGIGTWPAFWMLPSDNAYGGWPDSGEIDVLEYVGCSPNRVFQTIHTGAYNHMIGTEQGGETERVATAGMHLYAVDWTADDLVFTVDGETVFTFANDGTDNSDRWPFDQDFHLILNLAFGGNWGGFCGVDTTALPQEFRVDWVRVYQ